MSVLETKNRDWGFWGTMGEQAPTAWPLAFTAIQEATGAEPHAVRAFLDSRYGRHFADGVVSRFRFVSLATAIEATTKEWMAWRITQRVGLDAGIPAGLPYLTGFVINEGIADESAD